MTRLAAWLVLLGAAGCGAGWGQASGSNPPVLTRPPVVDSAPASPIQPTPSAPVDDASVHASPVAPAPRGIYVPAHAEIDLRLQHAIDSAHVRNGDMVQAALTAPLRLSSGQVLRAGTHVGVTILAVAAAGTLTSHGELTLQVTHVGNVAVLSDVLTFFGKDGHKDLPDSAPAKGTEASVAAGAALTFHVPPIPSL